MHYAARPARDAARSTPALNRSVRDVDALEGTAAIFALDFPRVQNIRKIINMGDVKDLRHVTLALRAEHLFDY